MAMHKYTLTLPLLLVKPHPQQTLHIVMNGHFLPLHTLCHFYLLRKVVFLMCSSGFDAKPVAQNACLPLLCRKHRRVLRFRVGAVDPSHREAGRCTSLWIGSSHSLWKQILRRRRTTVQVGTGAHRSQPWMKRNFNFKSPLIMGVFRRDVDCYDPEANSWSPCPPLRNHRVAHCVVNCPRGSEPGGSSRKSTVFVVGGSAKSEADTFCSEGLRTVETKHFSSNLSENGIDAFEWKVRNYI